MKIFSIILVFSVFLIVENSQAVADQPDTSETLQFPIIPKLHKYNTWKDWGHWKNYIDWHDYSHWTDYADSD